jgi:glycosyltransferase involved in cell wall biosynthesis
LTNSPTNPTVTVILSTYHYPTVLRVAIQSALYQTFTDFELLVIGDHCTDNTEDVVRSFTDPRIQWYNLPENTGSQSGPNVFGIQKARGEYIAYLNQDDVWAPNHLEVLVKAMRETGAEIAHTYAAEYKPFRPDVIVVCGIPGSGFTGPDKLDMFAASTMHRTDIARERESWKDWRVIKGVTPATAWRNLLSDRSKLVSVPVVTLAKQNASERPKSYVEKPSHLHEDYLRKMTADPVGWVIPELLKAVETVYLKKPMYEIDTPEHYNDHPGAIVEYLRRLRGLPPEMELPGERVEEPTTWQRFKAVVRGGVRRILPESLRKRAARTLLRASQYIE